jgi:uncharacterized protein DUF2793
MPTANLALPIIEAAQAQKHVTHNEALRVIDTLVQLAVADRDLNAPPGAPAEGQCWIVKASPAPTGAWAGHGNHVAAWQDGAWQFSAPRIGWVAYVVDEGTLVAWSGSAWGDFFATVTAIQNLARLGVGTTADATNPFSAKLNNALWTGKTVAEGGDGNVRTKLSKESAAKTASLLLQDNFSGRAEIGLTGDDDLHVKVSADGATWFEGFVVKASSGQLQVAQTTDASSVGSGAAAVLGGASIAKKLYMGDGVFAPLGSAGAPTYTFGGDGDTGMWSPAANKVAWSAGGAEALRLESGTATFAGVLAAPNGAAGAPAFTFASDPDCGLYRIGANNIGLAVNGAKALDVAAGNVNVATTTASTSTTTGALTVNGGAGLAGALNAGGAIAGTAFAASSAITSAWTLDATATTVSVANGASAQLPSGSGLLIISNATDGDTGVFVVGGIGVVLIAQSVGATYVASAAPAAGKIGVGFVSGTGYAIFNNIGGTVTLGVVGLRSRVSF